MWARWYISTASATRKRAESYQTFGFTGSAWNAMAELPRRDRQGLSRTSSSSVAGGTPNCVRLVRGFLSRKSSRTYRNGATWTSARSLFHQSRDQMTTTTKRATRHLTKNLKQKFYHQPVVYEPRRHLLRWFRLW